MFKSLKGSISNFINNLNICGQNTRGPLAPQKFQIGSRIIQEEALISEGGYGYIWKAHDIKTKEKFAVKKMICQVYYFYTHFLRFILKEPREPRVSRKRA